MVGKYKLKDNYTRLNCKEMDDYVDETIEIILNDNINDAYKIDMIRKILTDYEIIDRY